MSRLVCSRCYYLKPGRKSQGNSRYGGRFEYWCGHPDGKSRCGAASHRAPGFIGWSRPGEGGLASVKTSPRWCPLKGGDA